MPPPTQPSPSKKRLTPREEQLVGLILEGATNKIIAIEMGISEETVKRHMSNVMDKSGMSTRLEVALHYYRRNPAEGREVLRLKAENALLRSLITVAPSAAATNAIQR